MKKPRKALWILYVVLMSIHNFLFLPASISGFSQGGWELSSPISRVSLFTYQYTADGAHGIYTLYNDRILIFTVTLTLVFLAIDYILKNE